MLNADGSAEGWMLNGEANAEVSNTVVSEADRRRVTSAFSIQQSALKWAHQDSNLGRAGYEPAALTAELWAHNSLQSSVGSR
jgi:hypothetical protein